MTVSRFVVLALLATGISGHDAFASRPVCAPACSDSLRHLSGTVTYRERMALPEGAVLSVRIEERGEKPGAPLVMAEQRTALHGGAPFSYELTYPSLPPEGHYVLRADITLSGAVLFATPSEGAALDQPSLLLQRVAELVTPAQGTGPATPQGNWVVEQVDGRRIAVAGQAPTLMIGPDGHVSGYDGCNRFMGHTAINGASMSFSSLATTRMACLKPVTMPKTLETILSSVTSWRRDAQGRLILSGAAGYVILRSVA